MPDYATIIATIDDAINTWAGKSKTLTIAGRTSTYHSLSELISVRKYYAGLAAQGTGKGYKITNLKAASAR